MDTLQIIGGAVLLVACIVIILLVLMQESKQDGLSSTISGGSSESFLDQNNGRTKDAKLSKWTKYFFIGFLIIIIALNLIAVLTK